MGLINFANTFVFCPIGDLTVSATIMYELTVAAFEKALLQLSTLAANSQLSHQRVLVVLILVKNELRHKHKVIQS